MRVLASGRSVLSLHHCLGLGYWGGGVEQAKIWNSKITSQRLLDQSQAGVCIYGENATYPPILAILGLFAYPTPRG